MPPSSRGPQIPGPETNKEQNPCTDSRLSLLYTKKNSLPCGELWGHRLEHRQDIEEFHKWQDISLSFRGGCYFKKLRRLFAHLSSPSLLEVSVVLCFGDFKELKAHRREPNAKDTPLGVVGAHGRRMLLDHTCMNWILEKPIKFRKIKNCNQDSPSNCGQQLKPKLEWSVLSATGSRKMSSTAQCKNLPRHTPWTELPEVSAEHLAFCIFSQLLVVRLVALVVYSCLTGISLANLEARDLPPARWSSKNKKRIGCRGTTVTACASRFEGKHNIELWTTNVSIAGCSFHSEQVSFIWQKNSLCVPFVLSNTVLWDKYTQIEGIASHKRLILSCISLTFPCLNSKSLLCNKCEELKCEWKNVSFVDQGGEIFCSTKKPKKKPGAPFTHLFGKSAVVNLPTVLGMEARDVV